MTNLTIQALANIRVIRHASLEVFEIGCVTLACTLLFLVFRSGRTILAKNSLPLPPGPDTRWFNPGPRAPEKYAQLTETYGPVFSFRQGSHITCVIGRYQAAVDIMQKQGSDLVDRPRFISGGEIMAGGMRTLLVGAGDRIRKLRRALISQMQPNAAVTYRPLQMRNALTYMLDIIRDPDHHVDHARRYAASVVMTMTYGKTTPTYFTDPEVVEMTLYASRMGKLVQVGAHVVDRYPILSRVPWVTSTLKSWHCEELGLFNSLVDDVQKRMECNTVQSCFVTYLLERQNDYGLSRNELAYLAGSMFGAGMETSASAISFVTMAAAIHPAEQAKVQEEIDAVVGRDRCPNFEDSISLPRVTAFFLESFRWRPVSWGGFGHRATKDIIWNGYVIPKGATVIGNHWAIRLDPDMYPDPHEFKPDRWLDEKGNLREDMNYFNFGFGRRVCVGQHVAKNGLFINTALLLWAFKIDEDSEAPIDTMGFTDTANVRTLPFTAKFEPRADNIKEIIEAQII